MAPVAVMWSFVTDVHARGALWSPIRMWHLQRHLSHRNVWVRGRVSL